MEDWEDLTATEPEPEQQQQTEHSMVTRNTCERPATEVPEAAPAKEADGVLDAMTLWQAMNTSRRWNSTVQMLQNKLRQDNRGTKTLRDAFIVAAEDFVLPGRLSQHDLKAKVAELAVVLQERPEWAWLDPVVQRLDTTNKPDKKDKGPKHVTSVEAEAISQGKMALLFAICCVYNPEHHFESDGVDAVLEAIPARFQIAVTGQANITFGTGLLAELLSEQSTDQLTSIGFNVELASANRKRAEIQARVKQSARERQLYGQSMSVPTPPEPLLVPCTFTLSGPDCAALKRVGDKVTQRLRADALKRQRGDFLESSSKRRAGAVPQHVSCGGTDTNRANSLAEALADSLLAGR